VVERVRATLQAGLARMTVRVDCVPVITGRISVVLQYHSVPPTALMLLTLALHLYLMHNSERKCTDTIGTVPVPWAGHFQC